MIDEGSLELVRRALAEDIGAGDVTSLATVPADAEALATITQKQPGVIFGIEVAEAAFRELDPSASVEEVCEEGVWLEGGVVIAVAARTRALLGAERTALNLLTHLSGVATAAARATRAVEGTQAKILDTRKTTPGLRRLEKQAVAAGGAHNHRAGLFDRILIKDNHIAAAGSITAAVDAAREAYPALAATIEVEVTDSAQIDEALAAEVPVLLLDNMSVDELRAAVERVAGRAGLEASGGATLETLGAIAATGVEWISMGALTHSAPALDLSLTIEPR